jgi:hypothetical protein
MRRHHLASVAAIALALGMSAAPAQNVDQGGGTDKGKQTDQTERSQLPTNPAPSPNMPQQRRDLDRQGAQNQQGAQAPQQSPPSTAGQSANGRQQNDRQPTQGQNQQQGAQQQQNTSATSGQSQQGAREPGQGQNQDQNRQQGAQAPQQNPPRATGQNDTGQTSADRQQGARPPEQKPNEQQQGARQQQNAPVTSGQSQPGAREPQQGQNQQQGAQAPQTGRSQPGTQGARQGGESEQPDKSGRIALDGREQQRIGDFVRQQRIQPVTNINFSLSVGSAVPSSVRVSRISGELANMFPHYRDFSFFVARQELVIVDSQSYRIVAFVPISGGGTADAAPPREETGTVGTATPPAPAKTKPVRTERKRVTVTEEKPRRMERETMRRGPTHTETDVTVGTSRREIEELDEPPPRERRIGPPVRERFERDEGPPFPFSLFFGRPN